MNRCLHMPVVRFFLLLALAGTLAYSPGPVAAQTLLRPFPPSAKRGTLVVTAPPQVLIDGRSEQLSPGARIKSVNNLLVLSASLVGTPVLVNYVRDPQGLIHEVWILSAQEAQQKLSVP